MNYHAATERLFGLQRFGSRPGTEAVKDLLAELGEPQTDVAAVQIAGSNGKGSTARTTERILREAGLSVGLYTSPAIEQFRDRIRVDGQFIPEQAIIQFVERIEDYLTEQATAGLAPTFFETVTAMALWHFARQSVDVAILEVGIGGSKDATSIVDPIASAVTSVSLEHTDILGESVSTIAQDMATVAPADRPLVTGANATAVEAIEAVAGTPITVGPEKQRDVTTTYHGITDEIEATIELEGNEWNVTARTPLLGAHQAENAGVAAVLARQVTTAFEQPLATTTLTRGIRKAHWPGRYEVMKRDPLVVLDGAHNAGAARRLAETIEEFDYEQLHLVVGIMHDKPHQEMINALPTPTAVTICRPQLKRAAEPAVLVRAFEQAGIPSESITVVESTEQAVASAEANANVDDAVVVTGSLYTVREARARWSRLQTPKRIETPQAARRALDDVGQPSSSRYDGSLTHHVIETRLPVQQARHLKAAMTEVGGTCVITEHPGTEHRTRVVVAGTTAQFQAVQETLRRADLAGIGTELVDRINTELNGSNDEKRHTDQYPWQEGTAVMGILNVTPDSFHDGGEFNEITAARRRAEEMITAGVDVIDVGGESTRPGAAPVGTADEIDRVVPVIEAIADLDAMVSVDTRKAAVARAALDAGADIINDVSGLSDPEMRFVAAEYDAPLVVMHSLNAPVDPESDREYDDVVRDVIAELQPLVWLAEQAGLDREQILIDPGLGFGKSATESFELLARLEELEALDCPIMVGHSHKSMFELAGYEHGERLAPTVAATAIATDHGADLIRVHDPTENVAAVRTAQITKAFQENTWDQSERTSR